MSTSNYLSFPNSLCSTCNKSLPMTGEYIRCFNCGSKYHFAPCGTLSESTYSVMTNDKKQSWKCHKCRGDRSKSPNNIYQEFTYTDKQQQDEAQTSRKQQRSDEVDGNQVEKNDSNKRFKDSMHLNTLNSNVSEIKSDLTSFKSTVANDLNDIKTSINLINTNITASQNTLREEMSNAFTKLTETIAGLATQISDLKKENIEKDIRMQRMENKINTMEQQLINKNVEIKNVNNNITAIDAVKTIAASVNVNIQDSDINNSYTMRKNDKIIVEFCSLNKKQELMSKLRGHRVRGDLFSNAFGKPNPDNNEISIPSNQTNSNFIYINDQLTANNRRLLWQAKIRAKESGWKFVWVRNGSIFAKKNETTSAFFISNKSDIEQIA